MKYLTFRNGDKMPALGLGTWKSREGEVYKAVRTALKAGYRHIDCAPVYMNEPEIGRAFSDAFSESDLKREDLWVTSKLWNNAHLPQQVEPALRKTLADLQLDYIDLWLIHWPVAHPESVLFPEEGNQFLSPEAAPLTETWTAMEAVRESGLAKHIGVSNFGISNLELVCGNAKFLPEINQVEMHPYLPQQELVDWCQSKDIHLTAYSPLGSRDRSSGMKGENEPDLFEDSTLKSIADAHQVSPAQICLAWAVNRNTSVIPKSTNADRIRQNLEAGSLELSGEDMKKIEAIEHHFRYIDGSIWTIPGSPYSLDYLWK